MKGAMRFSVPLFGLVFLTSGCSYFQSEGESGPEISTTATGAAVGAVAGAGLGAIVGSATGDAGAGLVIGTVAGSATGALVGSQLEKQDVAITNQKESLKRQEEEIAGNKRQIEELRKQRAASSDPQVKTQVREGRGRARLADTGSGYRSLNGRRPKPFVPNAHDNSDFEAPRSSPPVRIMERTPRQGAIASMTPPLAATATPKTKVAPSVEAPTKQIPATKVIDHPSPTTVGEPVAKATGLPPTGLPPATPKTEVPAVDPSLESDDEFATEEAELLTEPAAKAVEKKDVSKLAGTAAADKKTSGDTAESAKVAKAAPASNDPGCKNAEVEAKRARSSSSDADKLFYLRRAIRLCPGTVGYHLEIGEIYKSIGRDEDAVYEANQVLELDPNNQEAKRLLTAVEKRSAGGVDQGAAEAKVN